MGQVKKLAHEFTDILIAEGDKREFDVIFELVTTFDTEENRAFRLWYEKD